MTPSFNYHAKCYESFKHGYVLIEPIAHSNITAQALPSNRYLNR